MSNLLTAILLCAAFLFVSAEVRSIGFFGSGQPFPTLSRPVPFHQSVRSSEMISITDLPDDEEVVRKATYVPSLTSSKHDSYAAYATINKTTGGYLFFWFFEAESGRTDAPTLIWLQGGPGCGSCGAGNFVELGPYSMDPETKKISDNPYTWNKEYNLLFIDQPVGAGFSFIENEEYLPTTEEEVADQLFNMLSQFFTKFSSLQKNELFIFGESYAGKYVPAISYRILNAKSGEMKINLKGMGIGDGITDPINQMPFYDRVAQTFSVVDEETASEMAQLQREGIEMIKNEQWSNASAIFGRLTDSVASKGKFNVYDVRAHKGYDFSFVDNFLNSADTKEKLHVGDHQYDDCYGPTMQALTNDMMKTVLPLVESFLKEDSPVRVLLYNGQWDFIITACGAENWISKINWYGREQWVKTPKAVWTVGSESFGGYVKAYGKLTQIDVANSGHLVPMNQPMNAQDMVSRFVEDKPFY